jgi:hypothetical protein
MTEMLDYWFEWPDKCTVAVVRKNEEQPCDRPAIAVSIYTGDEWEHHTYPVCMHHARGRRMMPLPQLIKEVIAKHEKVDLTEKEGHGNRV